MSVIKSQTPIINWGKSLTQGLFFHVPLFEGGGPSAQDIISRKNGTFQSTEAWTVSSHGNAVRGGQTGQYINFFPVTVTSHTLAVVINVQTVGIANFIRGVLARGLFGSDANGDTRLIHFIPGFPASGSGGNWGFEVGTSGGQTTIQGGVITVGKQYVIVGTYDSITGGMILYENGIPTATGTTSGTFTDNGRTWELGAYPNSESNTSTDAIFSGAFIWTRVLNPTEVFNFSSNPWQIYRTPNFNWLINTTTSTSTSTSSSTSTTSTSSSTSTTSTSSSTSRTTSTSTSTTVSVTTSTSTTSTSSSTSTTSTSTSSSTSTSTTSTSSSTSTSITTTSTSSSTSTTLTNTTTSTSTTSTSSSTSSSTSTTSTSSSSSSSSSTSSSTTITISTAYSFSIKDGYPSAKIDRP